MTIRGDKVPVKAFLSRPTDSMRRGLTESKIVSACLAYLNRSRTIAWAIRMNVGAATDSTGRLVRFGFPGLSDIIGQLSDGRFLAIEVKMPGKKPTDHQQNFLTRVEKYNGVAYTVHSVDELDKFIKSEIKS